MKTAINLQDKLSSFEDQWAPKVIAEMNDYQFKLVKLRGEFVWHNHQDTDETYTICSSIIGSSIIVVFLETLMPLHSINHIKNRVT